MMRRKRRKKNLVLNFFVYVWQWKGKTFFFPFYHSSAQNWYVFFCMWIVCFGCVIHLFNRDQQTLVYYTPLLLIFFLFIFIFQIFSYSVFFKWFSTIFFDDGGGGGHFFQMPSPLYTLLVEVYRILFGKCLATTVCMCTVFFNSTHYYRVFRGNCYWVFFFIVSMDLTLFSPQNHIHQSVVLFGIFLLLLLLFPLHI